MHTITQTAIVVLLGTLVGLVAFIAANGLPEYDDRTAAEQALDRLDAATEEADDTLCAFYRSRADDPEFQTETARANMARFCAD